MISYTIREGFANIRRAKFATFASTSAITVALTLIGVFSIVAYKTQEVSSMLREQAGEMEVFIEQSADAQGQRALHARIETMPGVSRTEFISHEDAAEIFRREFGEQASAYDDPTFLPASVKVWVAPAYAVPDSMSTLATTFESWPQTEDVVFNQALLARIAQNRRLVNAVGLTLAAIVGVASVFLVANTIRLTIYARRLLIRTMKLVGATDRFIRRPFLVEGILQGFVGGTLASLIVWGGYRLFLQQMDQPPASPYLEASLAGALVVVGVLLGWLGSYFAARRFIRKVELH
jgi:cell division transport system permease protein